MLFADCTITAIEGQVAVCYNVMKMKGFLCAPGLALALRMHYCMRVVLSTDGGRISPVLDAARRFALMSVGSDGVLSRKEVVIADEDPVTKATRIVELGAGVLICGAISWPLEAMLRSAGMRVIPNTCGPLDEVAAVYFAGELTAQAFLLPGCPGRQHRHRHRHVRRWRNG